MFIRNLLIGCIALGLSGGAATAKGHKPHPVGSHPKPAKHVQALRPKVKPSRAH